MMLPALRARRRQHTVAARARIKMNNGFMARRYGAQECCVRCASLRATTMPPPRDAYIYTRTTLPPPAEITLARIDAPRRNIDDEWQRLRERHGLPRRRRLPAYATAATLLPA